MATAADLLADLDGRLDGLQDPNQTTKLLYLSHGIAAMWPKIYRTSVDLTPVLDVDQWEYEIDDLTGDHAMITRVDVESGVGTNRWLPLNDFELVPTLTGKAISLDYRPAPYGARLRVVSAKRVPPVAGLADLYLGPPGTEELPVWYALGLCLSKGVEPRTDYKRYATTVAANGVDLEEMIVTAQYAFAQFELLLERFAMPLPSRVG